jgi:hypothetical protein
MNSKHAPAIASCVSIIRLPRALTAILFALFAAPAGAAPVNYALLTQGASLISSSSQYDGGCCPVIDSQIARDNLLRPVKQPWLVNGESGFIFNESDRDQRITLDLGTERMVGAIGAEVIPFPGDREVWDYIQIYTSTDNLSYSLWGQIGVIDGVQDGIGDISQAFNILAQPSQAAVRFIEYRFGPNSGDWDDGGSRVQTLFAYDIKPVPLPAGLPLFGAGLALLGFCRSRQGRDLGR